MLEEVCCFVEFTLDKRSLHNRRQEYDCVAYAVAKLRGWELLTGDKRLRKYAEQHSVVVHGLLWTVRECESEGIKFEKVLNALHVIYRQPRIRVPSKIIMVTYIGLILKRYRGERRTVDYYVNLNCCA